MPGIFISYRREDASGHAGRLVDDLREHFYQVPIFQDIEAIHPGTDFVHAIQQAIASSSIMLILIGPDWLEVEQGRAQPRLYEPNDFVRLEIAWALHHRLAVIPIVVGGARMIGENLLPPDVRLLARLQAHELSDTRWRYDLAQLCDKITNLTRLAPSRSSAVPVVAPARPQRAGTVAAWVVGGVVSLGILAGIADSLPSPSPDDIVPGSPLTVPLDLSGTWHDASGLGTYEFRQVGSAVAVSGGLIAKNDDPSEPASDAEMQPSQGTQLVIAGQGQLAQGLVTLNVNLLSPDGSPLPATGTLVLTPVDERHMTGILDLDGQRTAVALQRRDGRMPAAHDGIVQSDP